MVSKLVTTGIRMVRFFIYLFFYFKFFQGCTDISFFFLFSQHERDVPCDGMMTAEERSANIAALPPRLGGTAAKSREDWSGATNIAYDVVTRALVARCVDLVTHDDMPIAECLAREEAAKGSTAAESELIDLLPQRVMLVAKDTRHAAAILELLLERLPAHDLFWLNGDATRAAALGVRTEETTTMSERLVAMGKYGAHPPKVVVVPHHFAEGYTLTWCTVMLTSVYPSNQATRDQLNGRINRLGHVRKVRAIERYHCGLLTIVMVHHNGAKNLRQALEALSSKEWSQ